MSSVQLSTIVSVVVKRYAEKVTLPVAQRRLRKLSFSRQLSITHELRTSSEVTLSQQMRGTNMAICSQSVQQQQQQQQRPLRHCHRTLVNPCHLTAGRGCI